MSDDARGAGIDLAWLLALAGLMATPTLVAPDRLDGAVASLLVGPPLSLFAMLAGVSAVMVAQERLELGNRSGAVRAMTLRGLSITLIGVAIVLLASVLELARGGWWMLAAVSSFAGELPVGDLWVLPIASHFEILLVPLGLAVLAAAPMLIAPTWALGALTALLTAVGGWVVVNAWLAVPPGMMPEPDGTAGGVDLLRLAIIGQHPLLTLATYVLIGMLVGRSLLFARARGSERRVLFSLAAVGAVAIGVAIAGSELGLRLVTESPLFAGDAERARSELSLTGPGMVIANEPVLQLVAQPNTGTPADVLRTAGLGILALVVASLVGSAGSVRVQRMLVPLRAAGAAPITVWVAHVLLFSMLSVLTVLSPALVVGWGAWSVQVLAAVLLGAILATFALPGPLDRWVHVQGERFGGPRRARPSMPCTLPDDRSIAYVARFRAPIGEVWRALTEPQLVARWLADPVMPIVGSVMDVRAGGGYRHAHRAGWTELVVAGSYLLVEPPHRIVQTLQAVGGDRAPVTAISTLSEADGFTVLHTREVFETQRLRDEAVRHGLPIATAIYRRLADLVEARAPRRG